MSRIKNNDERNKKFKYIDKNHEIFEEDLIVCNEDKNIIEMNIKGYQEMAEINLQIAVENESELLLELNDYETWLCGV